jgi:hypothetical protein
MASKLNEVFCQREFIIKPISKAYMQHHQSSAIAPRLRLQCAFAEYTPSIASSLLVVHTALVDNYRKLHSATSSVRQMHARTHTHYISSTVKLFAAWCRHNPLTAKLRYMTEFN